MIEEHVVVGAQAKEVVRRIGPVVRRPEGTDVRGLGVGAGQPL
jgi:hypothetical protein